MNTEYSFDVTLHPWGALPGFGAVGIDSANLYGYFERKDGSEGGGLWFYRNANGQLELIDFDGTAVLPRAIVQALRQHGVMVDADFE